MGTFDEDLFEKGLARRKATLGADYVQASMDSADDLTRPFQEAMTAWAWGFGWGDDAIDARTRSMMNLAMLGALGKMHEWGAALPRRAQQRRHARGDPRDLPCRGDLLRRAAGA